MNLARVEGIGRLPFAHRIVLESLIRNQSFDDAAKLIERIPSEDQRQRPMQNGDDDDMWNFDARRTSDNSKSHSSSHSSSDTSLGAGDVEIRFHPSRVLFQDFSCLSSLLDLAALRDAAVDSGIDAEKVSNDESSMKSSKSLYER